MPERSQEGPVASLTYHRFNRYEPMFHHVCSPPDGPGRPDYACPGCGVVVTDEEIAAFDAEYGLPSTGDIWLDLIVAKREA